MRALTQDHRALRKALRKLLRSMCRSISKEGRTMSPVCWLVCWTRAGNPPVFALMRPPETGDGPPLRYYMTPQGHWDADPRHAVAFGSRDSAQEALDRLPPQTWARRHLYLMQSNLFLLRSEEK